MSAGTEADLLRKILIILDIAEAAGKLHSFRLQGSGVVRNVRGKVFVSGNPRGRGISDLMIFLTNGKTLFWELKTNTGRLNQNQKEFARKCNRSDPPMFFREFSVIRSEQDAINILKLHLTEPTTGHITS